MNTPTQMRGGLQATTIDISMNEGWTRPIDISEQTMPMLSLRLYAATPPLEVDFTQTGKKTLWCVRQGAELLSGILSHQLIFPDRREEMNQLVGR